VSKRLEAVFSESQVMMLVEDFNSNLKLVFEGISAIDKKLDDKAADLQEGIAVVDCKVMGLSKRLDSVEKRLSDEIAAVKADVAKVKADLAIVKVDVAEVKADVSAHRNNTEMHTALPKRPLKRA